MCRIGDGDDGGDVEPERHVEVPLAPLDQRPEEVDREDHPDDRDRDVDGPLELGVFLGLREAERQRDARPTTMIDCQPQKWNRPRKSENIRALHSRCVE